VILITACESLTHCWSKSAVRKGAPPPTCPRCVVREPADVILELIQVWADVRREQASPFRILAWNWEWAYYYPDPQEPLSCHLPEGVELLLDIELGGMRTWRGKPQAIGEYSLSYAGPCQRFLATRAAVAARGTPVHAKIQINATHELCSVPNLPVLKTVHTKLKALLDHRVSGFMGCWSMACQYTLNTAALQLFLRDPSRASDEETFFADLAREYLGLRDTEPAARAWRQFSAAFEQYPFSIPMLYNGPHNDAPARRLSLRFEGKPAGRSWMPDEAGDDFTGVLQDFDIDDVVAGYSQMRDEWLAALPAYEAALENKDPDLTPEQQRHRREELSTARMLGVQIASITNVFRFARERGRIMKDRGLVAPCDLPRDPALLTIMRDEIANAARALPLVEADARLGFHDDCGYKYNAAKIREKIAAVEAEL
jgi:hypothetical protein